MFAAEQQLAWYQHGAKVPVDSVLGVDDLMELRHPPMPDEPAWIAACRRCQDLFGRVPPAWRSPSNLGELAGTIRTEAKAYAAAAATLVGELERHVEVLGLDPAAGTGRLTTARRVARLLAEVANETDDVAVVERVARADLGEVDEAVVGTAVKTASAVTAALAGVQWSLLDAICTRAAADESAQVIVEKLRYAARHDQSAADLAAALREATAAAAALLAGEPPPDRTGEDQDVAVDTGGAEERQVRRTTRTITDIAGWDQTAGQIRAEVQAGRSVTVTWEVR